MKTYQRLFVFALAALALTALLSPWAAFFWHWFGSSYFGVSYEAYPYSRIFNRFFMISGIVLFIVFRRWLRLGPATELGLLPRDHAGATVGKGTLLALVSMILLAAAMTLNDTYTPGLRHNWSVILSRCANALLAAAGASFFEEFFFRGIVFKGLRHDLGLLPGYLAANLFFAAVHFVQPADDAPLTELDPWAGFVHLAASFRPFLDIGTLFPGLLGLFLIGVILCYAFERTGTLYLAMGLHAGWIIGIKTIGVFGRFRREDLGWLFGSTDPKIVSGVATWIGIVLVGLAVHWLTRAGPLRHARPLRATGA
ncbi:MAG: CPBP family intramembrane metalloprotease [Deltaproteobacteria bacterium]|nr:CPBP family intramembrane metalloprotease [Deltaproteobacteria bacterium]